MRLSSDQIQSLQYLLKKHSGRCYSDEQTQEAGLLIIRFVIAKAQRKKQLINMEKSYDNREQSTKNS